MLEVCAVSDTFSRVDFVFSLVSSMVFRNVIPDIKFGGSFVFSQSCFQVSANVPSEDHAGQKEWLLVLIAAFMN